ncbi:DUF1353 domain-containing protein [Rhodococcus sp. HNM0569]|uniref:DUF1353 domain-containing protein n=1 Tax=Rhodococcus sp. HNM0569 TaxID=2716340 RepID=UPI00146A5F84|nr:DUF1353 domain-containing protein [Rhodococcus sp. HNM0569]NLU81874.1 DUF1353 domain-containing protein [Rhodococcus sp. HNM0569]
MPFQKTEDDPSRPEPVLKVLDSKFFQLESDFVYVHGNTAVHVPSGHPRMLRTDLASVPAPLHGLVTPYGRQVLPAILHDDLCRRAIAHEDGNEYRRHADEMFRLALIDEGVGPFRSRVLWLGTEMGRLWTFTEWQRFAMIGTQVLGMLLWVVGIPLALAGGVWWLALVFGCAPVVLSLTWRRDFPVAVLGSLVLPFVGPAYVLTVVIAAVLWLPDAAWWLRRGRRTERPPFGAPTNRLR